MENRDEFKLWPSRFIPQERAGESLPHLCFKRVVETPEQIHKRLGQEVILNEIQKKAKAREPKV